MTVAGVDKQVVLAAGQESSKELKRLIQKGVNLEATYKEEGFASARTPLIHACVEKRYENVKLLLQANVDVNKGNPQRKTALMIASQMERPDADGGLAGGGCRREGTKRGRLHCAALLRHRQLLRRRTTPHREEGRPQRWHGRASHSPHAGRHVRPRRHAQAVYSTTRPS